MIKAVIFDMDGVLIDTERLAMNAWRSAAAELGLHLQEDWLRATVGSTNEDARKLFQKVLPANVEARFFATYTAHCERLYQEELTVKSGAQYAIQTLRDMGMTVALATSTRREKAIWRLRHVGLWDTITHATFGDEVPVRKPDPAIYTLAVQRVGLPAEQCLAVEDSYWGVLAARAAGMRVLYVPDLPQRDITPADYDELAQSLHELPGIVSRINAGG